MDSNDKAVAGLLLFFLALIIGACFLLVAIVANNAPRGNLQLEKCQELSGHYVCQNANF